MRAGAYTIHQSLTAEAAAVLKLALALARRRGHAQVTPLHVAFALLTGPAAACSQPPPLAAASFSSPSSAAPYDLLKRACLRSHTTASSPAAAAHQHPLQCRALELCFNVALNRLPTSGHHSPPSAAAAHFASPLIQPNPTLSNALVAALKRAQANQRRGCVELQQPPPPPPPATAQQQQQQQPLLAIKVELDQLVISILDDPSVSRVMREAGFSSATVKSNLEEETALMPPPPSASSSSPLPPPPPPPSIPPHFFLDPISIANGGGNKGVGRLALWPAQFLASPSASDAYSDDVRAVLEVMVRKEGRRSNPVVVGDSVSMAEAVAGEVLRRLERGGEDVPVELAGAHLLKLQLSYVHVRLMSRGDVEARTAELRRSVDAVVHLQRGGGGLVVYVGDLRWALVDEEPAGEHHHRHHATASSYSPVEHMVAELGRLLDDLRASRGRAWLVATGSYQTYMRWQEQRRRRPVESAWALQAVVVPTGSGTGLALNSLHSSSSSSSSVVPSASAAPVPPAMATAHQLLEHVSPFAMAAGEPTAFAAAGDEPDETQLLLCTECSKNYEREASLVKAEAGIEGPRGNLPAWLSPPADQTQHHKEKYLIELKRKWSRLCRKLHLCVSDPCPWWSGSCFLTGSQSKPTVAGFLGLEGLMEHGTSRTTGQWSPSPLPRWGVSPAVMAPGCHGAVTTLALGTHPLSDSATSNGRAPGSSGDGSAAARDLERRLRRNIPWQPAAVATEIAEAVVSGGKGVWLYLKGSDHAAARRVATLIAEARCGCADRVIWADPSRFSCAEELCSDVVSRAAEMGGGDGKTAFVVVVDDVENAPCDVVDCLVAASKRGSFKDRLNGQELDLSSSVVILTTSKLTIVGSGDVIGLRVWSEDEAAADGLKRRTESSPQSECKRARHDALDLNLNLSAEEDTDNDEEDDEAVPSDITHEGDSGDYSEHGHPDGLLESIAALVVTLEEGGGGRDTIRARLAGAMNGHGRARVEEAAVQALAAASGHFIEEVFERWATEVVGPAAAAVRDGGKGNKEVVLGLGLGPGCGARETAGFMGSVLPSRVHVD